MISQMKYLMIWILLVDRLLMLMGRIAKRKEGARRTSLLARFVNAEHQITPVGKRMRGCETFTIHRLTHPQRHNNNQTFGAFSLAMSAVKLSHGVCQDFSLFST
jgi:hypothetical protein